jgi:hypothetical protein
VHRHVVGGGAQVEDDEIGTLAGLEAPDEPVQPERPRPVERRHARRLHRQDRPRILQAHALSRAAVFTTSNMSCELLLATPSVPSATVTPAPSISTTAAIPSPKNMLLTGLCTTDTPPPGQDLDLVGGEVHRVRGDPVRAEGAERLEPGDHAGVLVDAPDEGLEEMRVGVDHSGHHDFPARVDPPVGALRHRRCARDPGDGGVAHVDLAGLQHLVALVHRDAFSIRIRAMPARIVTAVEDRQ